VRTEPRPLLPMCRKGTLNVRVEAEVAVLDTYSSLDRFRALSKMARLDKNCFSGGIAGYAPEYSSILIRKRAGKVRITLAQTERLQTCKHGRSAR
jgi:hypothetical protein